MGGSQAPQIFTSFRSETSSGFFSLLTMAVVEHVFTRLIVLRLNSRVFVTTMFITFYTDFQAAPITSHVVNTNLEEQRYRNKKN